MPKIIVAILLLSVSASWAVNNNNSILPAIFMLLLDEDAPAFPDELEIVIGDDFYIPAFIGKDINSNVLIYQGSSEVSDQFDFSLVSGPAGLAINQTGLISFTATNASTLGRNTIEVEITEKSTGAIKTISFIVFVMQTEVIATGNISPAGGTVQNDWQDVVLHVPADAVTVLSTFKVLRGISEDLVYEYTVLEPANVNKALSIRLPHPKLRNVSQNPYLAPVANESFQDIVRSVQSSTPIASDSDWPEWTSRPANYIRILSAPTSTNRLKNDIDELQPAGKGIENDTKTASKLKSLCPESDYSSSSCNGKEPVLFVHGYIQKGFGGGNGTWGQLRELIGQIDSDMDGDGDYAIFEFTWRTNTRFVDASNDLAAAIRKINKKSGKKVHIVAHSFGGLLARTYLQGLAQGKSKKRSYQDNVQSLVTLGTPHSGIFRSATSGFPAGQDHSFLEGCLQISCNQAGEWTPLAWTYTYLSLGGFQTFDYSDYFGVDVNPGGLVKKLDSTKDDDLPVDTLVLIGLLTDNANPVSDRTYRNGDNLISFAGQRFDKTWNQTPAKSDIPLSSGATVTETVMGFAEFDSNARPGQRISSGLANHLTTQDSKFTGYYHTLIPSYTPYARGEVKVSANEMIQVGDFGRPHAAYSEIKQWLAIHSSDPKTSSDLTLTVSVKDAVTNSDVPDAQVEILIDDGDSAIGTTNVNGQASIEVPFQENTPYIAIVSADGYRSEEHNTNYLSSATVSGSSSNFGTIYLQNDTFSAGSLVGKITDKSTGLPIAGVNYTLIRNTIPRYGTTDSAGNFNEVNLVKGAYKLILSKPEYRTQTIHFYIIGGNNSQNITLNHLRHKSITSGNQHTCLIEDDKTVNCWGQNSNGQLGNGTTSDKYIPTDVPNLSNVISISAGNSHVCSLISGGNIKCWGGNQRGELGNGTTSSSSIPVDVIGISNAIAVQSGYLHTCALISNGTVKCWGDGRFGQLGTGMDSSSTTPVQVLGIGSAKSISVGVFHSCALLENKTVKCWGRNSEGGLGNGTTDDSNVPVSVSNISSAESISQYSNFHNCVVLTDKSVRCWGLNSHGQLGNGTTDETLVPVQVLGISNASTVSASKSQHVCAVLESGNAKCWGYGGEGRLGDGSSSSSTLPVDVVGISEAMEVSAGSNFNCILLKNSSVSCWGYNGRGQLGNGSISTSLVPTPVTF